MKNIGVLFKTLKSSDCTLSKQRVKKAFEIISKLSQGKLKFFISTFDNYSKGYLKKASVFEDKWKTVENQKIDLIFDRARSNPETNKLKENIKIKIINDSELNNLCWDKLKTYELFPDLVPKTTKKISELKGKIIIKPRYGIMGKDVRLADNKTKLKKDFIAQEFIDNSSGIKQLNIKGAHDLRVMIINGEIDHGYVRVAKPGCLTSNCTKGGNKVFLEKIPKEINDIVKKIDKKISKYNPRIYAIDFVYDKSQKPWIIELESMPGFSYYDNAEQIRIRFLEKLINIFNKI